MELHHQTATLIIYGSLPAGAATAATLGLVDFLGVRDEIVEWGQVVVKRFRSWIAGADRFSRTELLGAAHTVIVIAAFYEGLGATATGAGLDVSSAQLTRADHVAFASGDAPARLGADLMRVLVSLPLPLPTAELPYEQVVAELEHVYIEMVDRLSAFITDQPPPAELPERTGADIAHLGREIVRAATERYQEMFRQLRLDVPEFDLWMSMHDGAASRSAIARIPAALEEAGDRALAARATELILAYRARLDRSVIEAGGLPDGIHSPTLREAFVSPSCRSQMVVYGDPGAETWWANTTQWPDAYAQVAGLLLRPPATKHPLVILGQPGSGKTSLLRVLAADLPNLGFLATYVELRSVSASAPVQTQIEDAIYQQTGRRVEWPELDRSAGRSLPVVLIDGLDELLQASGGDHADYLERVEEFQRREAELGRPVAVIVTARTVVGARMRFPAGTIAMRLESFDDDKIDDWLERWNRRALSGLRAAGRDPLTTAMATAHGRLAHEPLLLLMLAVYHAGGNPVGDDQHSRAGVYERLLAEFARREILKGKHAPRDEEEAAVEWEMRRLSVVAAAMFNRGRQSIRDTELDDDLVELLPSSAIRESARDILGRFFFVHESKALMGTDRVVHTYEFLHATFGEFLFARLVVETVRDLAEEHQHQSTRPRPSAVDVGLLRALLSYAPLTVRTEALNFCRELLADLSAEAGAAINRVANELLAGSLHDRPTWSHAGYAPLDRGAPARHAVFSANLLVLAVLSSPAGSGDVAQLGVAGNRPSLRSLALLWQSQLGRDGWRSLIDTLRMGYRWDVGPDADGGRDVLTAEWTIGLEVGQNVSLWDTVPPFTAIYEDLGTVALDDTVFGDISVPADDPYAILLRQLAFAGANDELFAVVHAVAPLYEAGLGLGPSLTSEFVVAPLARALVWLRLAPATRESSTRRFRTYLLLIKTAGKARHAEHARWMPILWRQFVEDAWNLDELDFVVVILEAIRRDVVDTEMCRLAVDRRANRPFGAILRELDWVLRRDDENGTFDMDVLDELSALVTAARNAAADAPGACA